MRCIRRYTDRVNDQIFVASARRISIRMALLCAAMVVAGATVFFVALWWKATKGPEAADSGKQIVVSLDFVDLGLAAAAAGIGAIILAGVGAFFFSRQATAPLEEAMERQRTFIADASHELRTPLSTMHLRVQQLEMLAGPEVQPVVAKLRTDTQGMVDIVDDLLAIASASHDPHARSRIRDVVDTVLSEQEVQAEALEVELEAKVDDSRCALGEVALSRCLTALVSNALSHTPRGGTVTIEVDNNVVRVRDTGSGITGIDPNRIFDRFAHGDSGRLPSHGIGLALVRDTVNNAGGSVAVERTGPEGTTMIVQLKAAR